MTLIFTMMIMAVSLPLKADEAQCRDVLHKCDDALHAQQDLNALQKQIITDQESRHQLESKEIEQQAIWKPIAIGAGAVVVLETLILVFRR